GEFVSAGSSYRHRHDAAARIDPHPPAGENDDRRLALLDDGRARDLLTLGKRGAIVDVDLDGGAIEARPAPRLGFAGTRREGRAAVARDRGARGGDPPAHDLNRDVAEAQTVEPLVRRLEGAAQRGGVAGAARIVGEGDGDLVLLADIAQIAAEGEAHAV